MIIVPLQAVPSQTLSVQLGGQACQIALRQNGPNMYFDLIADGVPIVTGRICRNIQRLLLDEQYRGFQGDFLFQDLRGDTQPVYFSLGSRYFLYYLRADE